MIKMFVVHLLAVGLFQVALLASGVKSFSFYTAFPLHIASYGL